jgi:hypothetical protein
MQKHVLAVTLGLLLTPALAPSAKAETAQVTEEEAHAIGVDAYVYFYPLISVDITRRVATNVEAGKVPGFGPPNTFNSFAVFPTAEFKTVVRPNFDTLYSSAFLDMTKEPVVVSAPDTGGRYYLLPMLMRGAMCSHHRAGEPQERKPGTFLSRHPDGPARSPPTSHASSRLPLMSGS